MATQALLDKLKYIRGKRLEGQRAYLGRNYKTSEAFEGAVKEIMALPVRPSMWPAKAPDGRTDAFKRWYALRRLVDLHTRNEWLAFQQWWRKPERTWVTLGLKPGPTLKPPGVTKHSNTIRKQCVGWCILCKCPCGAHGA